MQLIYAIDKNTETLVHVDMVPNGNQCHCKCPGCGEDLIAKNKGKIKDHHFAHDQDHVCHHGYQTQLHLLSKAIFSEVEQFQLPDFQMEINAFLNVTIQKEKRIQIKEVLSEERIDSIIPDVKLIDSFGDAYLIEIKVTHAVDEVKKEKIKALNLSCLEIDLSNFELSSKDELKKTLLTDQSKWQWIYLKDEEKKHKQLMMFTETISLIDSSNKHRYTTHCPLGKFKDTNISSANYVKDCQHCPFKLANSNFEDQIQCGGKLKIKTLTDLEPIDHTLKTNEQIIKADLKDGTSISFPVQQKFKIGSILDLWEGRQMLVKQMNANFAFVIKENPHFSYKKDKKVYGDIYLNKIKIRGNTPIFGFLKNSWYKIIHHS